MTPEKRKELIELRRRGLSIAEISRREGYSASALSEWLNESPLAQRAKRMRSEGHGIQQIAETIGVPSKRVSAWTSGYEPQGSRLKYGKKDRDTVEALKAAGWSERAISRETGIPRSSVKELLWRVRPGY